MTALAALDRALLAVTLISAATVMTSCESDRHDSRPSTAIIDRPMDPKFSRPRDAHADVDMIVIHFSSDVVRHPDAPYDVEKVIAIYEEYGVSAHYLIDRSGRVYRLVPERRVALHAGKGRLPWEPNRENRLNEHSIGIELLGIGSYEDMKMFISRERYDALDSKHIGFTAEQYLAMQGLIDDIATRRPAIRKDRRHVIGHDEYAAGRRTDPGALFDWSKIGLAP